MNTQTKYIFGFLIFASVVVVLIAYGISTHEEPGMMEGVPSWSSMPLTVCAVPHGRDSATAITAAVRATNTRLGFDALVMSPGPSCEIVLTTGVPHEAGWMDSAGDARFTERGGKVQCDIRISNVHGELEDLVMRHELGHCFGLAHDDFGASIMRPEQWPTPERTIPPTLTDDDVELLQLTYGPGLR